MKKAIRGDNCIINKRSVMSTYNSSRETFLIMFDTTVSVIFNCFHAYERLKMMNSPVGKTVPGILCV